MAATITASPLSIEQRSFGGILLCTGANSTGECTYKTYPLHECHQLEAPFFENTNTFALDGERFSCYPTLTSCDEMCNSPTGCTVGAVDFHYENKYNLGAIGWDKLIRSFKCFLNDRL
ncbi:hypothetical protein K4F52_002973 [Lecanicillium sp. MT-2017a]|nr:hypothetical protein K4F52_002973 [Lecanicillium sp. MT-2017a]